MNYIKFLKLVIGSALFSGVISCSDNDIEPLNNNSRELLSQFQKLEEPSITTICDSSEPGERLILTLKLVDDLTKDPLPNVLVKLYHANNNGEYNPTNMSDESTARLSGSAVTDSLGRILINTILPGDYGSSTDNRHIHTSIYAVKPKAIDIGFLQYSNFIGRLMSDKTQHFFAKLYRNEEGILIGFVTLEAELRSD